MKSGSRHEDGVLLSPSGIGMTSYRPEHMRAYKFLEADGSSIWSGTPWPLPSSGGPGPWVESDRVDPCRAGIHACRADALAYWLRDTLWEIELDGEIVEARHKVAARRGRLVRPIDDYPVAMRELNVVCAWRARDHAAGPLRAAGEDELADRFERCTTMDQLDALGADVTDRLDPETRAAKAAMLAVDTATFALSGPPPEPPFIAACAAGYAADDFDAAYSRERRFQSDWLGERLGLGS
jgi:hypothetical protein